MKFLTLLFALFLTLITLPSSINSLWLPAIIDSYMVLQRAPQRAQLWGSSQPASIINITWDSDNLYQVFSNDAGYWSLQFPPLQVDGKNHTLMISDNTEIRSLHSVVIGDVIICSGQSNMELGVNEAFDADQAIKSSMNYPMIRIFTIEKSNSTIPLNNTISRFPSSFDSQWQISSPSSVNGSYIDTSTTFYGYLSAVCFYTATKIYDELHGQIPLGLIETAFSGTPIETWSSPDAMSKCDTVNIPLIKKHKVKKPAPLIPIPRDPSLLWNAMLFPIINFRISQFLWYQGESNAGSPNNYACRFPVFIEDLREKFQNYQLTFLFVLLAAFQPHNKGLGWPLTRQAQLTALNLPYVGVASAIDSGDPASPWTAVHSRYKAVVGERLALQSLKIHYKTLRNNQIADGPLVSDIQWPLQTTSKDNANYTATILVRFSSELNINTGLRLNDTRECDDCCNKGKFSTFTVLTNDGQTHSANSIQIYSESYVIALSVELSSTSTVIGLQLMFEDYPQCSLINSGNIPALPFKHLRYQ